MWILYTCLNILFVLNILLDDDSRVILQQIDGEEGSDYINANHIDVRILWKRCVSQRQSGFIASVLIVMVLRCVRVSKMKYFMLGVLF